MKVETVSSILRGMFRAQVFMPPSVQDLDFYTLSVYHRMVLLNDGSTQSLVMARFLEPLTVVLSGRMGHLDSVALTAWLGEVNPVRFRKVQVQGLVTGTTHVAADVAYVPSLLPGDLVRGLEDGALSVGGAIRDFGLATRRELLWCGRTPDHPVVRAYRIYHNREPVFSITERFA